MKIHIFLLSFSLLLFLGCGSITPTTTNQQQERKTCINEMNQNAIIRWGGHNMKTNKLSGYQLNAEAKLFTFRKESKEEDYVINEFSSIEVDKFCELLDSTQKYFLEIQALNAPGDSSHFVELINPSTGINLRAVWNVRFKTYGSIEFRRLFDTLEAIADREYKLYLRRGKSY